MEYRLEQVEEYQPKGSYYNANPFTTAFCRTRDHGNILLTGGANAVKERVGHLGPALVSCRYWANGKTRGSLWLENMPGFQIYQERPRYGRGAVVLKRRFPRYETIWRWRRIPSTFPRILRDASVLAQLEAE